MSLSDELNESLAKFCAIEEKDYWEVGKHWWTGKFLFPSNYNGDSLKMNVDISFHILEKNSNTIFLLQYIIWKININVHWLISKYFFQIWIIMMVSLIIIKRRIVTIKLNFPKQILNWKKHKWQVINFQMTNILNIYLYISY